MPTMWKAYRNETRTIVIIIELDVGYGKLQSYVLLHSKDISVPCRLSSHLSCQDFLHLAFRIRTRLSKTFVILPLDHAATRSLVSHDLQDEANLRLECSLNHASLVTSTLILL